MKQQMKVTDEMADGLVSELGKNKSGDGSGVSAIRNFYIFYSEGTNHNKRDDVAITEAINLDEAIIFFKTFYTNANINNVKIIDCNTDGHKEGYVRGIMIVSKY